MFDKILLAVNEQDENSLSLNFAEKYAKVFHSKVELINVVPEFETFSRAFEGEEKQKIDEWVSEKLVPESRSNLERLGGFLREKGVTTDIFVKQGIPSEVIMQTAEDQQSDLIILDSGREHSKDLLGGTALKVLRSTTVPVLTFNSNTTLREIKKILVPIDLYHVVMKFSLKYLTSFISSLSENLEADVTKLYVLETGNHGYPPEVIDKIREDCVSKISKIGDSKYSSDLETNNAAWNGIVNYAEKNGFDLIVISRYIGKDFRPRFLGSTAEKVIQKAGSPVITLNP